MRRACLTTCLVAGLAAIMALPGCIRIEDPALTSRYYGTGTAQAQPSTAPGAFNLFPQGQHVPPGPIGHDFPQSTFGSFALDKTTDSEVQASLGVPLQSSTVSGLAPADSSIIAPGQKYVLTQLRYAYAPKGLGQPANQHPVKLAQLVFFDHRLMNYWFGSGLPGEMGLPLGEQLLDNLKQGQTTREQAIAALGTPNVQVLHLVDKQPAGSSEIAYVWTLADGTQTKSHVVAISFDARDRMTAYTSLDNAHPSNVPNLPFPFPAPPGQGAPSNRITPVPQADREHT
jgi:hypothetical protein